MAQRLRTARANGELTAASSQRIRRYLHAQNIACSASQSDQLLGILQGDSDRVADAAGTTLGSRLLERRKALGLSQQFVADRISPKPITASYLSLLEADRREPSESVLRSLAEIYGVSPSWLLTGTDSIVTQRIQDLLRFIRYALDHHDLDEAQRLLDQLYSPVNVGRELYQDERDWADFYQAAVSFRRGDIAAALALNEPLCERSLDGDSVVRPALVGMTQVNIMARAADRTPHVVEAARAVTYGERALGADAVKDDHWYRLAATVVLVRGEHCGQLAAAISDAELWLDEITARGEDLPAAEAALSWNLGTFNMRRGAYAEAFALLGRARAAMARLSASYGLDRARLDVEYAQAMLWAHPARCEEALRLLNDVLTRARDGLPKDDLRHIASTQGDALLAAGRPSEALAILEPQVVPELCRQGGGPEVLWSLVRVLLALGRDSEALRICRAEADIAATLRGHVQVARFWRALADNAEAIGATSEERLYWYMNALEATDVVSPWGPARPSSVQL